MVEYLSTLQFSPAKHSIDPGKEYRPLCSFCKLLYGLIFVDREALLFNSDTLSNKYCRASSKLLKVSLKANTFRRIYSTLLSTCPFSLPLAILQKRHLY